MHQKRLGTTSLHKQRRLAERRQKQSLKSSPAYISSQSNFTSKGEALSMSSKRK